MSKRIDGLFKTSKPIRLGIWGLGRGMSFYSAAKAIGFEIVAGCDFNPHMQENFLKLNPGAWATDDAAKFLAGDFDAVLLATFCPAHADDAIACLNANKHVCSEVTSFHTMAEGVRLVEAVQRTGKVYNLAENYPHSAANHWLARKWSEGLFGELMYAEYEYVHEVRQLSYTYIDGQPINPGWQAHSWRSWLNFHYYNTHSLAPMMHITGLRPTRVTALPAAISLAGFPHAASTPSLGAVTPSLINMSNGSVVRNLMGGMTNDTHCQRIWGTKGAADMSDGTLKLRLGGAGHSPKFQVQPTWDELGELASSTGHGGGDFWVLYYFAREILEGKPAPFDIHRAADCTIPGILALKSALSNGQPFDVPDFRDKAARDAYRNDDWKQERFDPKTGMFPAGHDTNLTQHFSKTMRDLIHISLDYRAYRDWTRITTELVDPQAALPLAVKVESLVPQYKLVYAMARKIADAYPGSVASKALAEMLEIGGEKEVMKPDFLKLIKKERAALEKLVTSTVSHRASGKSSTKADKAAKFQSAFILSWKTASVIGKRPKAGIEAAEPIKAGAKTRFIQAVIDNAAMGFVNLHSIHGSTDGVTHTQCEVYLENPAKYDLLLGYDGGVRVFINDKPVFADPKRENPARPDRTVVPISLKRGINKIQVAQDTCNGSGWGFMARFQIPLDQRKGLKEIVFPRVMV